MGNIIAPPPAVMPLSTLVFEDSDARALLLSHLNRCKVGCAEPAHPTGGRPPNPPCRRDRPGWVLPTPPLHPLAGPFCVRRAVQGHCGLFSHGSDGQSAAASHSGARRDGRVGVPRAQGRRARRGGGRTGRLLCAARRLCLRLGRPGGGAAEGAWQGGLAWREHPPACMHGAATMPLASVARARCEACEPGAATHPVLLYGRCRQAPWMWTLPRGSCTRR